MPAAVLLRLVMKTHRRLLMLQVPELQLRELLHAHLLLDAFVRMMMLA
jgi:hypothetical protein